MNINKKLSDIQKKLVIPKSQTGHQYTFRNCEDILEALKPHLGDCTLIINDDVVVLGNTALNCRYYIKATVTFSDGENSISTSAFAREPEKSRTGMDEQQITGSSSSYARKKALGGLFAIDDVTDADSIQHREILAKFSDPEVDEIAVRKTAVEVTTLMEKDDAAGAFQLYHELNRLEQALILTAPTQLTKANITPLLTTAEVKWFKESAVDKVAVKKQQEEQEKTKSNSTKNKEQAA
jgi:hypothetical protein